MLDTYFKKWFWTFHLLVVFAVAFLLARTVNAFIGESLRTPPEKLSQQRPGNRTRARRQPQKRVDTSAFLARNLFDAEREDLTPEPETPEGEAGEQVDDSGPVDMDDCQPSSLGANLLATFVARDPNASVAVFQDTSPDQETKAYRVGDDLIGQAEVLAIEWRNVYVKNAGRCEQFSLEEEQKKAAKRRPVARARPKRSRSSGSGIGEGIEKTSDTEWSIPRKEIDNVLSNLNKVATQARIVPSFHNGKANGFKLFSIRPNSLYSKIGIQNGDIVQKINGFEINSPDKALEIYSKLKNAQSITVDLTRRGKQKTLTYSIR